MFLIAGTVLTENGEPSQDAVSWWHLCSHKVSLGMTVGGSSFTWPTARCVWLRDYRCKGYNGAEIGCWGLTEPCSGGSSTVDCKQGAIQVDGRRLHVSSVGGLSSQHSRWCTVDRDLRAAGKIDAEALKRSSRTKPGAPAVVFGRRRVRPSHNMWYVHLSVHWEIEDNISGVERPCLQRKDNEDWGFLDQMR
jgi:hypothetical protein